MGLTPSQQGGVHPRKPLTRKQLEERQAAFENASEIIEDAAEKSRLDKQRHAKKAHDDVDGEIGWI